MRWIRTRMGKKMIHRAALRRVQVGWGDGWRVWTEWLDCCCGGCAHEVGVLMAIEACNLIGLCEIGERAQCQTESRGMKRDVPTMWRRVVEKVSSGGFLRKSRVCTREKC